MTKNDLSGTAFTRALERIEEEQGSSFSLREICRASGDPNWERLYLKLIKVRGGATKTIKKEVIEMLSKKYPKIGILFDEEMAKLASAYESTGRDPRFEIVEKAIKENDAYIDKLLSGLQEKYLNHDQIIIIILQRLARLEEAEEKRTSTMRRGTN